MNDVASVRVCAVHEARHWWQAEDETDRTCGKWTLPEKHDDPRSGSSGGAELPELTWRLVEDGIQTDFHKDVIMLHHMTASSSNVCTRQNVFLDHNRRAVISDGLKMAAESAAWLAESSYSAESNRRLFA